MNNMCGWKESSGRKRMSEVEMKKNGHDMIKQLMGKL